MKEDNDPNATHILSQTLLSKSEDYTAIDKKATYSPGDLILFDNYKSTGLVLKVQADALQVLEAATNFTKTVKKPSVSKKLDLGTKGVNGKAMKRLAPAVDRYHNTLAMKTLVKPIEKGPFKDCLCEIRAIYKN